jgi:hypothetical protein
MVRDERASFNGSEDIPALANYCAEVAAIETDRRTSGVSDEVLEFFKTHCGTWLRISSPPKQRREVV